MAQVAHKVGVDRQVMLELGAQRALARKDAGVRLPQLTHSFEQALRALLGCKPPHKGNEGRIAGNAKLGAKVAARRLRPERGSVYRVGNDQRGLDAKGREPRGTFLANAREGRSETHVPGGHTALPRMGRSIERRHAAKGEPRRAVVEQHGWDAKVPRKAEASDGRAVKAGVHENAIDTQGRHRREKRALA